MNLKLLLDCLANPFCTFLTFREVQIVLSRVFSVHPRFVKPIDIAVSVYDRFKVFSCFVHQIDVLQIRDIFRSSGSVKN